MRILLIHDFYQGFGGEDAVVLAERQLLEEHGNEIMVYTRHNDEIKGYAVRDKVLFFLDTIYSLRTRRELRALVRESRPDVAYIHNVFPLISPSVYHTLHRLGVPMVQVVHDFRFWCPNGWFYIRGRICERCKRGNYLNAVRYRCYRNSYTLTSLYSLSIGLNRLAGMTQKIAAFICMTGFLKEKLLELGIPEEKLFVKPHSLDASQVLPMPGAGDYVLYLGRLSPEKGIWTLIHAFEQLKGPRLKVVGTGPLEDRLKEYVRDGGLSNIELLGFADGSEKWELLRNSLFTVVPSIWYETFGLVVLEAYAAGKPVVGSGLGSLPYIIEQNKSGILFEPGCVDDLVKKVGYLLNRPDEVDRMGRYARSVVETNYSPAACYQKLMGIFSSVCRNGERRSVEPGR